ncbi:MAG: hypothetical protein AB3X44_03705 [Leptothrix sp. (in: b-proteobacteria)]
MKYAIGFFLSTLLLTSAHAAPAQCQGTARAVAGPNNTTQLAMSAGTTYTCTWTTGQVLSYSQQVLGLPGPGTIGQMQTCSMPLTGKSCSGLKTPILQMYGGGPLVPAPALPCSAATGSVCWVQWTVLAGSVKLTAPQVN